MLIVKTLDSHYWILFPVRRYPMYSFLSGTTDYLTMSQKFNVLRNIPKAIFEKTCSEDGC